MSHPVRIAAFVALMLMQTLPAAETAAPEETSNTPTAPAANAFPLWDGQETVAKYAERVNLPDSKTLALGNGVTMELVLIPAGKFTRGIRQPTPLDELPLVDQIFLGMFMLGASTAVLLVTLVVVAARAIRQRQRPKVSLSRLMVITAFAGVAVLGGMHIQGSTKALRDAQAAFASAQARYDTASQFERNIQELVLAQPFYLGKYTVTQAQYLQVMSKNPSAFAGSDLPVETVSFTDALAFCEAVAKTTNAPLRLPLEAEWEFACRAGTETNYYSGDTAADLDRIAWYDSNSSSRTHPVGRKEPNAFGLYDMLGNVAQWCHNSLTSIDDLKPQPPRPGDCHPLRGGSMRNEAVFCRAGSRSGEMAQGTHYSIGFRVMLPASGPTQ